MTHKAYKFRLYPNKSQAELMQKTFGCCRFMYNQLLARNLAGYKEHGKAWKLDFAYAPIRSEYDFLKEVSSGALNYAGLSINSAYKTWFSSLSGKRKGKKVSAPKFKSKHRTRKSFRLEKSKFSIGTNWIKLEKFGQVKAMLTQTIPEGARLISVSVSQDASGEYFASVLAEHDIPLHKHTQAVVGLDLGIKDFITLSTGEKVSNPKWFRESQAKLRSTQKHLSRKVKGSNRYAKQKVKVARVHRDIRNKRANFHHELSSRLVREFGVICVEDLNVAGMVKNRKLAKSISDAGWSTFINQLEYKSNWYGRTFVKVDRFFASSKTCNHCGSVNHNLVLSDREWTCSNCKESLDRDTNAAYNILTEGLKYIGQEDRLQQWSDSKP